MEQNTPHVANDVQDEQSSIDFGALWHSVRSRFKLYLLVLGITFVVACIYALSLPKVYSCKVMLAPELTTTTSRNSLSALASSFGLNMGATRNGSEALFPTLYPDLMNSVDFKTSLFPVKVRRDKDTKEMTYYDYLLKEQKRPWWSSVIGTVVGGIAGLFSSDDATSGKSNTNKEVNPFRLTKKQTAIAKAINSRVRCDVDKKTLVITIIVSDQDPLICATVADSVKNRPALHHRLSHQQGTRRPEVQSENLCRGQARVRQSPPALRLLQRCQPGCDSPERAHQTQRPGERDAVEVQRL